MSAEHNHPPRCCCWTDDPNRSYDDVECPNCPKHGALALDSLDEFQAAVGAWVTRCFPSEDPVERALVLCEESGEVARAVLKRHQGIRGTRADWTAELLKELGDVLICVAATAHIEGALLSEVISKRWADISARDYASDPQQHGVAGS